jgi:hypothetical protein
LAKALWLSLFTPLLVSGVKKFPLKNSAPTTQILGGFIIRVVGTENYKRKCRNFETNNGVISISFLLKISAINLCSTGLHKLSFYPINFKH